jgi:Protein of unknown function (DUF3109)
VYGQNNLIYYVSKKNRRNMIMVQDKLVSDELVEEQFICNLSKCKGACCWEGDFGAPVDEDEMRIMTREYSKIRPFLREEGQSVIDTEGVYQVFKDGDDTQYGATLLSDGRCAFLTFGSGGVAQCGIEKAWKAGATDFRKPISCHLYPIRVSKNEIAGFEALNYDRWDICSAACQLGKEEQVPVYQFLKEAIVRKYGEDFYEELDATAQFMKSR